MRDRALHSILQAFTEEAAWQLAAETQRGAEISFELVGERRRGRPPLYCYRPLTDQFIDERLGLLSALPSYAAAARALAVVERIGAYLVKRGEQRIPPEPRARADLALRAFLRGIFAERSGFEFEPARFELAYAELEDTLYDGQSLTTVVAPLLGVALDEGTDELPLGEGLSLIRGERVDEAPADAVWGERGERQVLAMLAVTHDPSRQPPLSLARTCFRRLLTALRLFEHGGYALGQLAWTRVGSGPWRPVTIGGTGGRPGTPVRITADQEDELRAFCNLLVRRLPSRGELAWALARFEMGSERLSPLEALTDYLLAAQALLEPGGLNPGLMPERLAAICVPPEQRPAVVERIGRAIALEREVIAGNSRAEPAEELVDELAGYLRALLRDIICGHLSPDLAAIADELLDESVTGELDPVPA